MRSSTLSFLPYICALLLIAQATAFQDDPQADLQVLYNGFFEEANLNDPTTVIQCYNENSSNITMSFFGELIDDMAANRQVQALADISRYEKQIPNGVGICLSQNVEFRNAMDAYNLKGKTVVQVTSGFLKLIATNYQAYHDTVIALNTSYTGGNYLEAGKIMGRLVQQAFPNPSDGTFLPF